MTSGADYLAAVKAIMDAPKVAACLAEALEALELVADNDVSERRARAVARRSLRAIEERLAKAE